jgi:hypothetical protein
MTARAKIPLPDQIEGLVYLLRGQRIMLDFDLAALYGVESRILNQAVKRNQERFPADFMFQVSAEEVELLAKARILNPSGNSSQIVMSSTGNSENRPKAADSSGDNSSQFVMSSLKHRGITYRYYAFTEQGVAMLSSVLRSPRAVRVNIEIMRAFIRLRQWLASNIELSRKLGDLEKKYDEQFKVVFDAIRELMDEKIAPKPAREIGFHTIQAAVRPKARGKSLSSNAGRRY